MPLRLVRQFTYLREIPTTMKSFSLGLLLILLSTPLVAQVSLPYQVLSQPGLVHAAATGLDDKAQIYMGTQWQYIGKGLPGELVSQSAWLAYEQPLGKTGHIVGARAQWLEDILRVQQVALTYAYRWKKGDWAWSVGTHLYATRWQLPLDRFVFPPQIDPRNGPINPANNPITIPLARYRANFDLSLWASWRSLSLAVTRQGMISQLLIDSLLLPGDPFALTILPIRYLATLTYDWEINELLTLSPQVMLEHSIFLQPDRTTSFPYTITYTGLSSTIGKYVRIGAFVRPREIRGSLIQMRIQNLGGFHAEFAMRIAGRWNPDPSIPNLFGRQHMVAVGYEW